MKLHYITNRCTVFLFLLFLPVLVTGCGGGTGETPQESRTTVTPPSLGQTSGDQGFYSSTVLSKPIGAGEICEFGGIQIESGVDENANGVLDTSEVDKTEYVCNGKNGLISMFTTGDEPSGNNCPKGGNKIETGLDANRNGVLDADEVDSTLYVCNGTSAGTTASNGSDGLTSLIDTRDEAPGTNCSAGGEKIETGLDDNGNGVLEPGEVDSAMYICNGNTGAAGSDGSAGLTSLISITTEPSGSVCVNGGKKIETGLDDSRNGVLENGEVEKTTYICNGRDGTAGSGSALSSVTGQITLSGTTSSSGATVSLVGTAHTGITDQNGHFSLNDVHQGEYTIEFSASGYTTTTYRNFRIFSGIDETLPPVVLYRGQRVAAEVTIYPCMEASPPGSSSSFFAFANDDTLYLLHTAEGTKETLGTLNSPCTFIKFSPDSSYVVFGEEGGGVYSVPVSGGTPELIGSNLNESVLHFTPDSSKVVYLTPSSDLYTVPVSGGTPLKLAGVGSRGGYFNISPDSSFVVYSNVMRDLLLIPVAGGTPVSLGSSNGSCCKISPDSSFIAYEDVNGDLFVTPKEGGTPRKLSLGYNDGYFEFSRDSGFVIYRDRISYSSTHDLYSSPVTGGTPTKIGVNVVSFSLTEAGGLVLYIDGDGTLYSVPVSGGTAVTLGTNLSSNYNYSSPPYKISRDSSFVVYSDMLRDLYGVPVTGGTPVKLGSNLVYFSSSTGYSFTITPDSSRVLAWEDPGNFQAPVHISGSVFSSDGSCSLNSVPITGGTPVTISNNTRCDYPPLLGVSPDSSLIAFRGPQQGVYTALSGGGSEIRIGSTQGIVATSLIFSPDSNMILYRYSVGVSTQYYNFGSHNIGGYQVP